MHVALLIYMVIICTSLYQRNYPREVALDCCPGGFCGMNDLHEFFLEWYKVLDKIEEHVRKHNSPNGIHS